MEFLLAAIVFAGSIAFILAVTTIGRMIDRINDLETKTTMLRGRVEHDASEIQDLIRSGEIQDLKIVELKNHLDRKGI